VQQDEAPGQPQRDKAASQDQAPSSEPSAGASRSASSSAASIRRGRRWNVLYLNHSSQVSGAEHSLRALLRQLRVQDHPVDPVVALPGAGPFADMMRDAGCPVVFAPLRRLQRPHGLFQSAAAIAHILQTAPYIARLVQQTSAHIVHSNSTTAHLVGGLAAERRDVPTVWHARDLVALPRAAGFLSARATQVIAISGSVAEQLQRDGVPGEKIRIIHNGIDPDVWTPHAPPSTWRASLDWGEDAFIFGCVSQLVPWKNHEAFIDAAARLCSDSGAENARFVIMGGDLWDEHSGYVHQLRARVKAHGLENRFHFVPHQKDNLDAIRGLDTVVLASREEPFGRVLLEGMALAKPVVAYAQHGPIEIVRHEHDGLLAPLGHSDEEAISSLAQAMQRVLREPELRRHLSFHARETVQGRFHIAESARQVLEVYRQIAD
jgi:glycosyltransferase involved in cell wall biosynthesis